MRRRQRQRGFPGLPTSFIDKLFIMIIVFLGIAILALILINPILKKKDVDTKAEFIIFMDWPKGDVDVDIWLRTPGGEIVYYQDKEKGFVALERDDTGLRNDVIRLANGETMINPVNHETVTIRGIDPGEYTVNIHLYRHGDHIKYNRPFSPPIKVDIQMQKINPKVQVFYKDTKTLSITRQELHVVKFTVQPNGDITDVRNDLPESITTFTSPQSIFNDGADLPTVISPNTE